MDLLIDIQDGPSSTTSMQPPLYDQAVGIDFGTTFCCVSLASSNQNIQVLGPLIPSLVWPEASTSKKSARPIRSVKRTLDPEQAFQIQPHWHNVTPFQAACQLFADIAQHIQQYAGHTIWPAVVTVPAYFDQARRSIIKRAAEFAGFEVLRLLAEPTAAAVAHDVTQEGVYGVYDLGGGTFDFSLVSLKHGLVRVLASGGHSHLGGDDFDLALAQKMYNIQKTASCHHLWPHTSSPQDLLGDGQNPQTLFNNGFSSQSQSPQSPGARAVFDQRLCSDAVTSDKPSLGHRPKKLSNPPKDNNSNDDIDAWNNISYEAQQYWLDQARTLKETQPHTAISWQGHTIDLQALWSPLVDRTLEVCNGVLLDAGLTSQDLQDILLVGGSTKLPLIAKQVEKHFQRMPSTVLDPDRAVAKGAARYAYNLIHEASFLLMDVSPLSLGIQTYGGLFEKIIPRNTPLPAQRTLMVTTAIDGQTSLDIQVFQGERDLVQGCRWLGQFHFTDIACGPKNQARIEISFALDVDGLLTVTAKDLANAHQASLTVNAVQGVTQDLINQQVAQEGEDTFQRIWVEKHHQAQQALQEVQRLLAAQRVALSPQERQQIHQACQDLQAACASGELDQLVPGWNVFLKSVTPFIERSMTHALQTALTPAATT